MTLKKSNPVGCSIRSRISQWIIQAMRRFIFSAFFLVFTHQLSATDGVGGSVPYAVDFTQGSSIYRLL